MRQSCRAELSLLLVICHYIYSGWVKTVFICTLDSGNCVLRADVRASQRMNVDHKTWVGVVKKTGVVICGHCMYMHGWVHF